MPTFRAAPSSDLGSAIRRAMASSNLGPMAEMQADMAAAQSAQHWGLAEKARAEVEALQRRSDPKYISQAAAAQAGMNDPEGSRLENHIRGVPEQPGPGDQDDAMMVGKDAQPYVTGKPTMETGQEDLYRRARAAILLGGVATGKSNAEQVAKSAGAIGENAVQQRVQDAIASGDLYGASAMNQGAKAGHPIVLQAPVPGAPGATFAPSTGDVTADPAVVARLAKATAPKAPAGYSWGPKDADGNPSLVPIKGGPKDTDSGALTTDAIEMAADRYRIDGTLPPNLGRGTQGAKNSALILGRAAEKAKESGDDGEAARLRQVANKASATALGQLSKQEAMVGAFEKNFNKNADLAIEQSKKVDRTGVPVLNRWLLAGKKNIAGDPDVAVLDTAIKASVNEYTKIISGSMGNDAMAEGEIKKVEGLLSSASTDQQVIAVLNFMKKETGNRMTSFAEQKAELTKGMRSAAPAAAATGDIEKRFSADPSVKGMKLGAVKDGKAEVLDASGKLVGYYE